MKVLITIVLLSTIIFAQTFKITESGTHSTKKEACKRALINAKVMAIEEYGVTISSSFTSKTEVTNDYLTKHQKQKIIQNSKHKVRVMSYKENISQSNGEYICNVDTLLSIGKIKTTKTVKPNSLKKYNKQYVRTCSVVVGVYMSKGKGKPIFLNFGRSYPNQLFSAVIWKNNRGNFSYNPARKLLNKEVCIKGEVSLYKGKPSINLKDESQIEF